MGKEERFKTNIEATDLARQGKAEEAAKKVDLSGPADDVNKQELKKYLDSLKGDE